MTITLSELRTRSRERADMDENEFISNNELNFYINQSIKELYDILVSNFQDDYYVSEYEFNITSGTKAYALPSDFYDLLAVEAKLTNDDYFPIYKWNRQDRNNNRYSVLQQRYKSSSLRYRLQGSNIVFEPSPSNNLSIRLTYVPRFTDLSSDTDTFDGINGWEDYVIIDAAIKMLAKEESDVSTLYQMKRDIKTRIEEMSRFRDAAQVDTITDVQDGYYDEWRW